MQAYATGQSLTQTAITTLIVGMGATGLSCARFLRRTGTRFKVIDSREQPPLYDEFIKEFADVELHVGGFTKDSLTGIQTVLLSPGIALHEPFVQLALQQGVEVIGDIEYFARHVNAPIIAITGSNGKSTVTTLVAELLSALRKRLAVGGNLGQPALDLLQTPAPDFYVLELSSFQLDTTHSLQPQVAAVLNVSPDHMDRYSSFAEYVASKAKLFQHAHRCVFNKDDPLISRMQRPADSVAVAFGSTEPEGNEFGLLQEQQHSWLMHGHQRLLRSDQLQMVGQHNALNALAALAILHALQLPIADVMQALTEFPGLPHRCQRVMQHRGVQWINDSKATNVAAAAASITSLAGPLILIAGGDGKNADFSPLSQAMAERVKMVVLFGQDAPLLATALRSSIAYRLVDDMAAAVAYADTVAQSGDTVLLAPACSSLDMYPNYQRRGEHFVHCVQQQVAVT